MANIFYQRLPMRLDRYLKSKYPKLTQGMIEKNIRYSNIKVDNKKCTAGTRVITGNIIKLPKKLNTLCLQYLSKFSI